MECGSRSIGERIRSESTRLAEAVVQRHYDQVPSLDVRYGPNGRRKCLEDAQHHLHNLAESVAAESPLLFADYIKWVLAVLAGREIPHTDLEVNLQCLRSTLKVTLSAAEYAELEVALEAGISQVNVSPKETDSGAAPAAADPLRARYLWAVLNAQRQQAVHLIHDAIEGGRSIQDVYLNVFQPVQMEIGRLWQLNKVSVAVEHYCTAVTQLIMSQLYPRILGTPKKGLVMVCASVGGDLHEIGGRMVADLFEMAGWDTYFMGANTPLSGIVEQVSEQKANLLGISLTMTYHLTELRKTISAVRDVSNAGVLVGGRPFNIDPGLWRKVAADGFAHDAASAVTTGEALILGASGS